MSLGGAWCADVARAFPGNPGEYRLLRVDNFSVKPGEPIQSFHLQVNETGPFIVAPFTFNQVTDAYHFKSVGKDLRYASAGGDNDIYPSQILGTAADSPQITAMADNYYHMTGVVPDRFVQLTHSEGKSFSIKSDFYVVCEPENLPTDWNVKDLGEYFIAKFPGSDVAIRYSLYKVHQAKGALFNVTYYGPFPVGTDGTLTTEYPQLKNIVIKN